MVGVKGGVTGYHKSISLMINSTTDNQVLTQGGNNQGLHFS